MVPMIIKAALALDQRGELSILGKSTILMVLGLIAVWLAGRSRASVRHFLLATTFVTLLALPLIIRTAPAVTIEVPMYSSIEPPLASGRPPQPAVPRSLASSDPGSQTPEQGFWLTQSWAGVIRWGWMAGAMLLLISLGIDLSRLRRIRRDGLPWPELHGLTKSLTIKCGIRREVELLLHEDITSPLTCGVWRPAIVMPIDAREWSEADLRRALIHELEHIRRGDWAIQLVARATYAFYWFHPLVWLAWQRLCLEAERACDDALSVENTEYAEQLVTLARRVSKTYAQIGMANRSDLARRVSALLDGNQQRGKVGTLAAVIVIGIAGLVMVAIAPLRTIAQAGRSTATVIQESGSQDGNKQTLRTSPLDRALFEAAKSGDLSAIDGLLNAGANINCVLEGDGSPLIGAARGGHLAAIRQLLDRGANPNLAVPGDGTPLIVAAREGHTEIISLLLDRGASIDQMVPNDENALIQASGKGHLQVVKLLVSRGADVNARAWVEQPSGRLNSEWRTPLSMARKGGHQEVVAFLIAAGAVN